MKICQVISGVYRDDPRVFQRQTKSLVEAGFDLCLLTNDGEPCEILDNIPIHATKRIFKNRLKQLLFAKVQFCQEALEINADAYVMHAPELLGLGLFLKRRGKIIVYDAYEDIPRHILEKDWLPKFVRKPISIIVDYYMKWSLKQYHHVISPHQHVVEKIRYFNPNATVITNFAKVQDLGFIEEDSYISREKTICYSGTVYLHSNQESILRAISSIRDVKYKIVGSLDDAFNERLSKVQGYEKLEFIGRIPWDELQSFYSECVIGLVIIDYKMNLGGKKGTFAVNKMFEYMAAGIPIICSDYTLWQEVINKHNCGICVQPGNVEQIRNAINLLLTDQSLAYEMGQNGRRAVVAEYNWSTQEEKLVKIFGKYI